MIVQLLVLTSPCLAQGFSLGELHEPLPGKPGHVVFGDLNGDGVPDAYGSLATGDVVYLGDGSGALDVRHGALPASAGSSDAALLLDAEADGDFDVFAWSGAYQASEQWLFLNRGGGSFANASAQLPLDTGRAVLAESGDLDGDGSTDLWVGTWLGPDVALLNDGAGSFSTSTGLAVVPSATTRSLDLGDVDDDGDLDALWVGAVLAPSARLFLNDGAGNFSDAPVGLTDEPAVRAEFVDIDGDCDVDAWLMLGKGAEDYQSSLWLNDGSGLFAHLAGRDLPLSPGFVDQLFADLDGDADPDLVVGTRAVQEQGLPPVPGALLAFANDGAGGLREIVGAFPESMQSALRLAASDVDGDGDVDLWAGYQLFLGDGQGHFGRAGGTLPWEGGTLHALGDIDGDGWLDAFLGKALFWKGDGTAFYSVARQSAPVGAIAKDVSVGGAFGDVDGDGDTDLLVVNAVDGDDPTLPCCILQDDYLWLNDGAGGFTDVSASHLPESVGDDRGVNFQADLVDLDGDGDLDVVQAAREDYDGGGGGIDVWINDGKGVFSNAVTPNLVEADAMDWGDVDGDGDVDLAVGEWPYTVHLYLNDGEGSFTDAPVQIPPTPLGSTAFLELGDLDRDGDLDWVVGRLPDFAPGDGVFGVWLNDGSGHFVDSGHPFYPLLEYRLFDVDGDGDPDLSHPSLWLENDGTGRFQVGRGISALPPDALLADLDGDRDLDAIHRDGLLVGLKRHLAWRAAPSLGKTLTMEVYGPASSVFVLIASAARLPSPVRTVLGGLSLDPSALLHVSSGTLAGGEGSASFRAPADPGFAGVSVWWQAAVGLATPRLTNLEPTTFEIF